MIQRILILALFCIPFSVFGQTYNTAAGLRMGSDWGFTFKQRLLKKVTLEGIVQSGFNREETLVTGLIERHYPLLSKRFNFYLGGGVHKGWNTATEPTYEDPFGITGIVGAEFTIARINLSYDFKPAVNLSGGEKNVYSQHGISIRYVLVKKKLFDGNNDRDKRKKQKAKAKKKRQKQRAKNGSDWKFWERN